MSLPLSRATDQKVRTTRRSFIGTGIVGSVSAAVLPIAAATAGPTPDSAPTALRGEAGTEADFIDRRWVEHTFFLTRKVSPAERFSNEPVIADASGRAISVAETKGLDPSREAEDEGGSRTNAASTRDPGWGGNPASAMGAVHPTKEGLVMWYVSPHRKETPHGKLVGYDKVVRYAISRDGRKFEQPSLDRYEFRGTRSNNIVVGMNQIDARGVPLSGPTGCSGFCVLDASRQPVPHARGRFTALYGASIPKRGSGLCLAWSDDGLVWNAYPENPLTPSSDTYCNFFYDPRTQRYALYIRPSAASDGLRAGPRGIRSLLSRIESTDLIHWDHERVVFDTDEADAPAQGTIKRDRERDVAAEVRGRDVVCYGMTVTPHQNGFTGVAQIYNAANGKMWCELAYSRNGIDWEREPRREPFIATGGSGAWDSGMVGYVAAGGPAVVGDDWYYYYTGNNWTHHFKVTAFPERGRMWQIGGVRLKRGRLVGYRTGPGHAEPSREDSDRVAPSAWANRGELLTRPFTLNSSTINVNADASQGRILAEICDVKGKLLPGFTREHAVVLQHDGVRLPLAFGGGASVASLRGRTIRLRLHLESSAVFGLSFV